MHPDQSPPGEDPYRSVWQMSQVGDASGRRRWYGDLKLGTGIIAGLVTFVPFGLVTSVFWGWWEGEANWSAGGWATNLIGFAAAFGVGAFVASES